MAEPLAAPLSQAIDWKLIWSSEDSKYGGSGSGMLDTRQWRIPGHTTLVLRQEKEETAGWRKVGWAKWWAK